MGNFLANVLAAFAVATVLPWRPAFASDDEKAVKEAIRENYAAYSTLRRSSLPRYYDRRFRCCSSTANSSTAKAMSPTWAKPGTAFQAHRSIRVQHGQDRGRRCVRGLCPQVRQSTTTRAVRAAASGSRAPSSDDRVHSGRWRSCTRRALRTPQERPTCVYSPCATPPPGAARIPRVSPLSSPRTESLTINNGTPSVGRAAITEAAKSFMTGYPDMVVEMARLDRVADKYQFHWDFTGTNTGPGGTGRKVRNQRLRGVDPRRRRPRREVARSLRCGRLGSAARQDRIQALAMNTQLRCRCGTIQGTVDPRHVYARAVCYCKDCQAFARFLGSPDQILDRQGGTEIVAILPAAVQFTTGVEKLACMSLSDKGLLRWYASCCRTPIGNTPRDRSTPYVGIDPGVLARN